MAMQGAAARHSRIGATAPRRRYRRCIGASLSISLVALCVAHLISPVGKVGDLTYVAVTLGAALVVLIAALRRPAGSRAAWLWIGAGVTSSGIGDAWYTVHVWLLGTAPDASGADVFYLGSYVALAIGLLSLSGVHAAGRRFDVDGLIDLGSFTIFSVVVVSQLADVAAIFTDDSISTVVQLVWAAYPVLDAALLAVLVRGMLIRNGFRSSNLLLAVGIAAWLAADFATLVVADTSMFSAWMDLGWMVGAAAIGAASLIAVAPHETPRLVGGATRVGGARVLISLCPLVVPGAIQTWAYFEGSHDNPIALYVSTVALVALAFARSTRLVRARDRNEAELARSERYYQALAVNSADAVIVIDPEGRIVNHAPHLVEMLGKAGTPTIGTDAIALIDTVDRDRVTVALERIRTTFGVVHEIELRAHHADGSERWFGIRAVNLADDPAIGGLIVNIHDVTDRKRVEQELTHRAFHDPLTGLANRALFHDRVEHALQRTETRWGEVVVVYLDLDGFKTVNDSRGHESGDMVLREISARLSGSVRAADTVARLGGDEFAILVEQTQDPLNEAIDIADRILSSLTGPVSLGDHQVVLSASIGIAVGDGGSTASSMLRDADVAMYRAKTTGKAKWTVYHPEMREAAVERLELETDLVRALAERQFEIVYQPIIELDSEDVVGFEALLRWHHPIRGAIGPDTFIPIAEDNGCIVAIGRWALAEACAAGAMWQRRHPGRPLTMAVNLSPRQLVGGDIVGDVRSVLARSGLQPGSLVLELTETALVHDTALVSSRLADLRALGVQLAIDDFGTGYSSLNSLRDFPVDILKIDRSFISTIDDGERLPAIVRGLLDLGRALDLKIVAEGIELAVQHRSLRDEHCQYGQGFLFSRPLSATAAGRLLDRHDGAELLVPATPGR